MSEIKLRANVRIGELVRELGTAQGERTELLPGAGKKLKSEAIAEAGLSKSEAYRMQELAGPRDTQAQQAGKAAAETYFAKARAIELYMQQQQNVEAERRACEIRLRAEHKRGPILRDMEKAKGGGDQKSDHRSQRATGDRQTLSDLGISKTQSSRWQKLAAVPDDEWEKTFAQPEKPSTTGIIAAQERKAAPCLALADNK